MLEPAIFPIVIRDADGNKCVDLAGVELLCDPPGALLSEITEPHRPGPAEPKFREGKPEECSLLTLTAKATGYAALHVRVCSQPMEGSPFMLRLLAGQAAAATSTASGAGIGLARIGVATSVFLITRDALGHRCIKGGALVHARLSPAGRGFGELLGITDHLNGQFTLEYVCNLSARYTLAITIDDVHVAGSPFTVDVAAEPTERQAEQSPRPETSPLKTTRAASPARRSPGVIATTPRSTFARALSPARVPIPVPSASGASSPTPVQREQSSVGSPKWVRPGGEWVRACGGGAIRPGSSSPTPYAQPHRGGGAGGGGAGGGGAGGRAGGTARAATLSVAVPNTPVPTSGGTYAERLQQETYEIFGEFGGGAAV